MFDTVIGLPIHVLVVHGVVVVLPVVAVLALWWAVRPPARPGIGWLVVAGAAAAYLLALVARQSGEALQARLGPQIAVDHEAIATNLPWFALALLAATVLLQLVRLRRAPLPGWTGSALTTVAALALLVWTVRAGHSGSEAVWGEIVKNTGK